MNGLDAISNPNASTWTFLWNYESPTCDNGTDFIPPSTSGATVKANNSASDFALLELDETPFDLTPSLCLYYNGWDKSGSTPSNTTCIHHPSGDIKKISIDYDSSSSNGNFWRVNDWDVGTTEGGSSGSPLFNSTKRIIGQLYGGLAACGNNLYDDFGKLAISWNNSTDSRRRLKDWLDPLGTNPNTLDGAYLFPVNNSSISGPSPSVVCSSGSTFSVSNLPSVDSIIWSTGSYLTVYSDQNTNHPLIKATGSGSSWVRARLVTGCGSITLPQKTVWAGAPRIYISGPTYTPNYQWTTYYAQPNNYLMAATDYEWILNPLNGNSVYDYGWSADIAFYNSGYYQVVARAQNTCGWSSYAVLGIEVYDSKNLSITPNPSNGEVTISIETTNEKGFVAEEEWEMAIYDQSQLLKEKKTSLRGKSTKIQTAGWKEGVYMVRVKYKDEILTDKLIVKK